jgi:hypothetical protein
VPTDADELEARLTALEARNEALERALAGATERRATRRRAGGRDWDAYAAVIASLVGLLALAVSGYTAYVQRVQLRAEVWPRLSLGNSNILLKLYLSNDGVGTARITATRVTVDGKPMKNWYGVVAAFGHDPDRAGVQFSSIAERVLPPERQIEFANPRPDEPSRAFFRDLVDGKRDFKIAICYCSILDDCWVARYGGTPAPERDLPEGQCPIAEQDRFRN